MSNDIIPGVPVLKVDIYIFEFQKKKWSKKLYYRNFVMCIITEWLAIKD